MWELDHKEGWMPKNWCFWTVVLEKTPESPLDCKEIQPVNPKGNLSWIFIERTDAEAETPYFGHLMWRADSLEKTLMLGLSEGKRRRDWRQWCWDWLKAKDEIIGWHHWCDGHKFWVGSGSWWWIGKPGVLKSMESQRVGHDSEWTDRQTLPTKVRIVKTTVFPIVRYGCESWTIKKAECQRIDAFRL